MKHLYPNLRSATTQCPAVMVVCALFLLTVNSPGQGSGFYDNEETSKAREANEKALKKMLDLPDPQPIEPSPSRFSGDQTEDYILARAAVFSMRGREVDPFMLMQDTTAKPEVKKAVPNKRSPLQAALPPTPLSEIVQLIRVTTIMPSEKKFLIGVREFSESDEFPLQYGGKTMQIRVVQVSSTKIVFLDIKKNEEATLEMKMLPPGMVAGGDKMQPPGMLLEDRDLPLLLGMPDASTNPNN